MRLICNSNFGLLRVCEKFKRLTNSSFVVGLGYDYLDVMIVYVKSYKFDNITYHSCARLMLQFWYDDEYVAMTASFVYLDL